MNSRLLILLPLAALILTSCDQSKPATKDSASTALEKKEVVKEKKKPSVKSQIRAVTRSETLIQKLSGNKSMLTKSLLDNSIDTGSFAHKEITYYGIQSPADEISVDGSNNTVAGNASFIAWPIEEKSRSVAMSDVWQELPYKFEDAQFGVLRGRFVDDSLFETDMKFEGRMRSDSGPVGVKSYVTIGWKNIGNGWKIHSWKPKKFSTVISGVELFQDVTDSAFPDEETLNRLSVATHEDLIVERCKTVDEVEVMENGRKVKSYAVPEARPEYKGCNDWGCVGQYPSVSTVDFDNDGHDDLFVTDRWSAPQLLRNNGDFTFTDVTAESGIDVAEMATCGYFFDFDNDGDSDLFLGMSMVPSLFFTNDGGKFTRHEAINETLAETRFVNAISIADINRDGLLDLYLSTYATGTGPIDDWIGFVTTRSEQLKVKIKISKADKFIDRAGPPNILLMNRGDNFEWTSIDDTLKQYRNSYQTSWMDYDGDGDHDLYICNDFSPDVFLRNDTPRGSFDVAFTDVTQEIIPTMDMGFGMGCDWGDYDNDGDLDLYVSNMYSKAGNRIVDQIEGTHERLKVAAHGNFLFQNNGGTFAQVAGDEPGMQRVARIGWSYGGQFADFDNDGELDLYVPSGCYSAPDKVKTKIDL